MIAKPNDIVFIACNDFDTLWYQRQALAVKFAQADFRVFYVNKTPQKWPRLRQLLRWFGKRAAGRQIIQPPENMTVVKPFWLVPAKWLQFINRRLVKKTFEKFDIRKPILITDVPSYNTLNAIEILKPEKIIYMNVHNYDDSNRIASSILESEKILTQQADYLFATSRHNQRRTEKHSGGRVVHRALPGVNFELFKNACRGNEAEKAKTIYFFGMVYDMVDIELYNRLSEKFKIVFVGEIVDNVEHLVSKNIEIKPPMQQKQLAEELKNADILGLFYKKNAYTKGVIPAKIFECLATAKPTIICGIEKDSVYSEDVYHFDGSLQELDEIINNLQQTEKPEKIAHRLHTAASADWDNRFKSLFDIITAEYSLPKFSVLTSVYKNDSAECFVQAIDSILNQTLKPDEIVLVKDGAVSEQIENAINKYITAEPAVFKIISLPENRGLGNALAEGVKNCSYEIIARMDADDVSAVDRFEKQLKFLANNPSIDVVSSFLSAFEDDVDKPLFVRRGAVINEQIIKKFRFRFCMNHPASMFRKQTVLNAGNYCHFVGLEDYHLWVRMILNGAKFAVIPKVLYFHRWQKQLLRRRGGFKRASQQFRLQREFLKIGFINYRQFVLNVIIRITAALMPVGIIRAVRIKLGI